MRPEASAPPGAGSPRRRRVAVSTIGSRRVDTSLAVTMSAFGALFSLQSVPVLLEQRSAWMSQIGLVVVVLVYGSIGLAGLAAILRHWTRPIFFVAAAAFPLALALWPLALHDPLAKGESPWLFALTTVPAGFLMMARRDWQLPAAYSVLLSAMIGVLRMSPAGGGAEPGRALLDAVYALALATALLVLTVGVRLAARSVDLAQQNALQRYADAQIDQATEYERVQIDALVHDRVLTTFLSAAKAETPEEAALAAQMARTAIAQLAAAQGRAGQEQAHWPLAEIANRIRREAGVAADQFVVTAQTEGTAVPGAAAEGLVAAAVQAMVNSVNHAGDGDVSRTVDIRATTEGVVVVVQDRGAGFDLRAVAPERLGVRVSILERMQAAGGRAMVRSAPGRGTTVTLVWPADAVVDHAERAAPPTLVSR